MIFLVRYNHINCFLNGYYKITFYFYKFHVSFLYIKIVLKIFVFLALFFDFKITTNSVENVVHTKYVFFSHFFKTHIYIFHLNVVSTFVVFLVNFRIQNLVKIFIYYFVYFNTFKTLYIYYKPIYFFRVNGIYYLCYKKVYEHFYFDFRYHYGIYSATYFCLN